MERISPISLILRDTSVKNCDINLRKTLTTRTAKDLRFRPRAMKRAEVMEIRQFNEIDLGYQLFATGLPDVYKCASLRGSC